MNNLTVEADTSSGTELLGKAASDLQTDIEIDDDYKVTGTLKYVTGYTGFSGDVTLQSGNYLALDFASDVADWIEVKLVGGTHEEFKRLDDDGILIVRITDTATQSLIVRSYCSETETTSEITLDLSGLTLQEE